MTQYEQERLFTLKQLDILDTPPSESFDRITRMASQLFDLPIAAVSLTDSDRQWFKSRVGVAHTEIPRFKACCGEVADSSGMLVINDLLASPYYRDSTLAHSGVRFYAGAPLVTREGYTLGAMCVLGTEPRDITDHEQAVLRDLASMVMGQIEMQHAYGRVDPLTGLANRSQFLEDLEDLGRDQPGKALFAFFTDLVDIEQMMSIQRVMGPAFLDKQIKSAVMRLQRSLHKGVKLYSVSPYQFVHVTEAASEEAAVDIASALRVSLAAAPDDSGPLMTRPVVGVAPFRLGERLGEDILRVAHCASQDARQLEAGVGLYSSELDARYRRRFALLDDFRSALTDVGQLRLDYQPRIHMKTGTCVGVEALIRWTHPVLGNVSPAEFIPLIEQTRMARPLTRWVVAQAVEQAARWQSIGLEVCISINVTALNLEETDFAQNLVAALAERGLPSSAIELELTESAMIGNSPEASTQLEILQAAGISIAIDDFGTGYSSLSYLQKITAQVVKIDRSFISLLDQRPRSQTLVKAMVGMAHDLGYSVVAEGIEEPEVYDFLKAIGCDEAQGYLLSRPLPVEAFERWLAQR
ncbi:sensor domain-containing phosphodiesterase [Stutzerimonas stutzeri]|uniref:Sensor domain-containing phosphodiesterase n=2 Tax=Stutzerimonas stutzeri TaxID=316 RepID=A0A2S4AV18_STUST|nr:GGDEF and EAL domain-containing protein [Stutzerimonas stutzeri]POH84947.1 sensor domain-containing phosphodiesterase [Stutzerimonas stutzeri]